MGKGTVRFVTLVCDTDTFTTKACGEIFKIQSGILNCNFQKVVYQSAEYVVKLLMLVMQKRNLEQDLIIIKVHAGPIEKKRKVSFFLFLVFLLLFFSSLLFIARLLVHIS